LLHSCGNLRIKRILTRSGTVHLISNVKFQNKQNMNAKQLLQYSSVCKVATESIYTYLCIRYFVFI
jgi:hypothetical protein